MCGYDVKAGKPRKAPTPIFVTMVGCALRTVLSRSVRPLPRIPALHGSAVFASPQGTCASLHVAGRTVHCEVNDWLRTLELYRQADLKRVLIRFDVEGITGGNGWSGGSAFAYIDAGSRFNEATGIGQGELDILI